MKKLVWKMLFTLMLFVFAVPLAAHAETKEVVAVGNYTMGEGESLRIAEERVLIDAKRLAMEQAGTYLESYSRMMNLQLVEDEVKVLVPGIIDFSIMDTNKEFVGDSVKLTVRIKAMVSTDKIEEVRKRIRGKSLENQAETDQGLKNMVQSYKKLQDSYNEQQQELKVLKEQLVQASTAQAKQEIVGKISRNEKNFEAVMWASKGDQYRLAGDYNEATVVYTNALKINPDNAQIYNKRGICYMEKGLYDKAIDDFTLAFKYNPLFAEALHNRSLVYLHKGEKGKADADTARALYVNPLPPDINITPPGPEITPTQAAFSGKWYGTWNNSTPPSHQYIVIESIELLGVTLVQANPADNYGQQPNWARVRGNFSDNVLIWANGWNGNLLSLKLQSDGTLLAQSEPKTIPGNRSRNANMVQYGVFTKMKE